MLKNHVTKQDVQRLRKFLREAEDALMKLGAYADDKFDAMDSEVMDRDLDPTKTEVAMMDLCEELKDTADDILTNLDTLTEQVSLLSRRVK